MLWSESSLILKEHGADAFTIFTEIHSVLFGNILDVQLEMFSCFFALLFCFFLVFAIPCQGRMQDFRKGGVRQYVRVQNLRPRP